MFLVLFCFYFFTVKGSLNAKILKTPVRAVVEAANKQLCETCTFTFMQNLLVYIKNYLQF